MDNGTTFLSKLCQMFKRNCLSFSSDPFFTHFVIIFPILEETLGLVTRKSLVLEVLFNHARTDCWQNSVQMGIPQSQLPISRKQSLEIILLQVQINNNTYIHQGSSCMMQPSSHLTGEKHGSSRFDINLFCIRPHCIPSETHL